MLCPACRQELARIQQQRVATRRPPLSFWLHSPTAILIAINVLVFLAMAISLRSTSPSPDKLIRWGANFGPLTLGGQWWRLLTSAFLHANILHIALNMWAFLNLGLLAELLFGRRNFVLLYLYCALGGSIASVWWHTAVVGVGASGAIFGIAGALLPALAFHRNQRLRAAMRGNLTSIAIFVFYNIAFGAAVAHIDNAAHLGGLFTGALLGWLLPSGSVREPEPTAISGPPQRAGILRSYMAFALVAVLLLAAAAFTHRRNRDELTLANAEQALRAGNQQQALLNVQRVLRDHPNRPDAHFLLGYIYLSRNDLDKALQEFNRTIELKPDLADAYSQVCVVYLRMRSFDNAVASCQKAISLDPGDPDKQYNLGLAQMARRDYPEAVRAFTKAAQARPNSLDENYHLALALVLNGDQQRAQEQLTKVLRIKPDFRPARDLLDRLKAQRK
jgi:membrane associated rhomboid family serine protease/Tfp pilus assembly protein PilF